MLSCSQLIKQYNKHMGGTELLDSIMGRHRIIMKSRKWYHRLFYHLLDMGTVNSWILYRRVAESRGITDTIKLAEFHLDIAHCLCRSGTTSSKRGRPSNEVEQQIQVKKTKGPTAHMPPRDVRQDQMGHLPSFLEVRQRCKMPGCKGFSWVKCNKCAVALCFHKNKNCFNTFHTK